MAPLRAIGLAGLAAGVLLLAFAAAEGDVHVGLFLIVPFVYGTGLAPFAGMVLAIAGVVILMMESLTRAAPPADGPGETTRRSSGVVLLGPIPIVWGNRKLWPWAIGAGVVVLLLMVLTSGRR